MAYGTIAANSPPTGAKDYEVVNQLAQKTADVLVATGGRALGQVGERAKRTFMGLTVDSFKTPTFIKDKIKSIENTRAWKSIKQYCVRANEAWGTVARWGMGGVLAGGFLFGSTVGAAFSMGLGGAVGFYFASNTWSSVARQQEQADQDAAELQMYKAMYGDITPDEPYKLTAENVLN
ncbi:hypothetical protein [Endozoicomonas sp. 4G]|uniref:hypothetical protein n=1 Tax=Endozoicomonas sp. 4G TaxID=2872754 RepID=UPI002078F02C|nr:hypothetical protein [Endozoicomonas sp. 4G]